MLESRHFFTRTILKMLSHPVPRLCSNDCLILHHVHCRTFIRPSSSIPPSNVISLSKLRRVGIPGRKNVTTYHYTGYTRHKASIHYTFFFPHPGKIFIKRTECLQANTHAAVKQKSQCIWRLPVKNCFGPGSSYKSNNPGKWKKIYNVPRRYYFFLK